ncbi:MAG: hypothetical protein IJO76_06530 [Clostridia bacterium]|nr:hypothetical protein [Clostridia bacterium]
MEKMILACAQAVEAFGKRLDALDTYVIEGNKSVLFCVETRLSKIEYVYTVKGNVSCPKSTLFVRLYPLKNRPFFLHLYELVREDDFRCTYFSFIENAMRMNACFDTLSAMVEEYLPALEALAMDEVAYEARLTAKQKAVLQCANIKEDKVPQDPELAADFWVTWVDFYEQFAQLSFFTNYAGYTAFLQGNLAKAKKLYAKRSAKGKLLPYEQRLLAFLDTPEAVSYQPLPSNCTVLLEAQSFSNGKEEGKLLLVSGSICYVAMLAAAWLMTGLAYLFVGIGTVYYPVDWVFLFIFPLGAAVFCGIALRRLFIPLVFRDKAERIAAVDSLTTGKKTQVAAWLLAVLTTVVTLAFTHIVAMAAPLVYEDCIVFDDGANFPFLNRETYAYEDLDRVCYIEGRWNTYDELVERGSYVLIFADGCVIDLDAGIPVKATEKHVLPLLESYIDRIDTYPSDRELAAEYGKTPETFFGYE